MSNSKYNNPIYNKIDNKLNLIRQDIISSLKLEESYFSKYLNYEHTVFSVLDNECIFISYKGKPSLLIRKGTNRCLANMHSDSFRCYFYFFPLFFDASYNYPSTFFLNLSERIESRRDIKHMTGKICSYTYHNELLLSLYSKDLFPFFESLEKIYSDLELLRKQLYASFKYRFDLKNMNDFDDFHLDEALKILNGTKTINSTDVLNKIETIQKSVKIKI